MQFTGGVDVGRSEFQRKTLAQEILMNHSPLFDHIAFGHGTWNSELITVDDESLGRVCKSCLMDNPAYLKVKRMMRIQPKVKALLPKIVEAIISIEIHSLERQ